MSEGGFLNAFYEADNGDVTSIRIQPETASAAFSPGGTNVIPAGPAISAITRVGGSRREYGRKARSVRISSSTPPTGFKPNSPISLPILTPDVYAAIPRGGEVTYRGATWRVVGKSPEGGVF